MSDVHTGDGLAANLSEAWRRPRNPLGEWVRGVSAAYQAAELTVQQAAEVVSSTQAELEAALRLDALDDTTLAMVSAARPPMTTWMLLSEVPANAIEKALSGLAKNPQGSAFESVRAVIHDLVGASPADRVSLLDHELFTFAEAKASQYGTWPGRSSSKNLKALKDFARRRRTGKPLTPKQAAYALGMLRELVDVGVIRVPSPDGDDSSCEAVLEAIG